MVHKELHQSIRFPREVVSAAAGIIGYSAGFVRRSDHEVGRIRIELDSEIDAGEPREVKVTGTFGVRDWSGEWDDKYKGNVQFVVLAELVPAAPPGPGDARGDLLIVDAEINQAIQHFRSHKHLAEPNIYPDNSIQLVAQKPTGVRLYVDYDRLSGLPIIQSLSGQLEVVSQGATTALEPLEATVPRRDNEINRGVNSHTLNFVIPEDLCRRLVTIRAKVFNEADSTQFSETFERTLEFLDRSPIRVFGVRIKYTGPDVSEDATADTLRAPRESAFANLFNFTELLYPIPSVELTGSVRATYDREVRSDISKGCDKLQDLTNWVRDFRGDSDDIFFGLLNSGVDTGSVQGCGGGGACVGKVGDTGTAAHELGHAMGRRHAPCDNMNRCQNPRNVDDQYPNYSGFDSQYWRVRI